MKTLIFTLLTTSCTINYYVSERYLLYERIPNPGNEEQDTMIAPPPYRVVDMQSGLEHTINSAKTERIVKPFTKPGRWEAQGKIFLEYEIVEKLIWNECECQKVKYSERLDQPLLEEAYIPKLFTFCKIPAVQAYVKDKQYLDFLPFYNRYPDIAPEEFTLNYQFQYENGKLREMGKVNFAEKDIAAVFFNSFLAVPEQ